MIRSHVIRLNTTPEQEVYFRKACGVARHAYNWALARWKEARAEGKGVTMKGLKAEYNRIEGERDLNASLNIRDEALRLVTDVPVVASSERKNPCGAGSAGSEMSETFCDEAGTKVS